MSTSYKLMPYNNENNPHFINQQNYTQKCYQDTSSNRNDRSKLCKLRKDYLKKLQQVQEKHKTQINVLKEKFERQKCILKQSHAKQIGEKQDYIKILQSLVKKDENHIRNQKNFIDDSKYIYTQQYSKNYVPFFEDIENQIDFKIELSKKSKPFSLSRNKQTQRYKNDSGEKISSLMLKSLSHHKLIPTVKPQGWSEVSSFKQLCETHKFKKHSLIN